MKTSNGLTVDDVMETLNCTRSYVYKLVRNGELEAIDGTMPVRVDVDSLIFKIKKLYPWIVYKLLQRGEIEAIEGKWPIRIDTDTIIHKIKRLYPWIVDSCISGLHYQLRQLELKYS